MGLTSYKRDQDGEPTVYKYSPHQDPIIQWAGKYEAEELNIPTVSLHVHERIDTHTILDKVMKKETSRQKTVESYFETEENNPKEEKKAVQFYQHKNGWSNRLIAGDSLLVMNSLLRKENMAGTIQMIFIDPPYGIKYGSNFQPFVHKKEVKDGKDADLSYTPETIRAFNDTWELEIHSYLTYLRDRLVLAQKLLTESGSCAVQISDTNLHYVRSIMDEIFGVENFVSLIQFSKASQSTSKSIPIVCDYIVWYAKDINKLKYNKMYKDKPLPINSSYKYLELLDGSRRPMSTEELQNPLSIPDGSKMYYYGDLKSGGETKTNQKLILNGEEFIPGPNKHWTVSLEGMHNLAKKNRLIKTGKYKKTLNIVRYFDDFKYIEITNIWNDTVNSFEKKTYVVQTSTKVIERFLLMTTQPGDLVLDPTCGSGTTAYVAEQYGRRWITCDTQRVAITLAKKRLLTAKFKYYKLLSPEKGVGSGFSFTPPTGVAEKYTTKTIAYDEEPKKIIIHDKPDEIKEKIRVSGPFTVEAVPSPMAISIDALYDKRTRGTHNAIINKRQEEWRDKLHVSGIRGRNGKKIEFIEVSSFPTTRHIHARGITNETKPRNVMVSFGPEHYPLEIRQVTGVFAELKNLDNKPDIVVFAGMQFDPEAANKIDSLELDGVIFLKAQMNADNFMGDLKKKKSGGDDFMIVGQPEIEISEDDGMFTVSVFGFDYYDIAKDKIVSGNISRIVMWMLDTDYDGRSVYPQQIFFPMGGKDTWSDLYRVLDDYVESEYLETYKGSKSLPFKPGEKNRVAVKIVDDRGIESMCVMEVKNGRN